MNDNYDMIMKSIMDGDLKSLKEYSEIIDDFPIGKDHFIGRYWITNAIDCGNLDVVEWMLKEGAPVTIGYQLLAKYPLRAKTPKAAVYEYYNPRVRAESEPVQLTVTKPGSKT